MFYAVIMAGGSGTRFWPLSRRRRPKQLLPIAGERPLVTETAARLRALVPPERTYIITNRDTVQPVRDAVPDVPPENVFGEPMARDTAGCIGYAAAILLRRDPDAVFAALPADHRVTDTAAFTENLSAAAAAVEKHRAFVTFGIRPTFPATGYGYIKRGARIQGELYRAERFTEKPDRAEAEKFISSGNYFWNSGMFVWRAADVRDALMRYEPGVGKQVEAIAAALGKSGEAEKVAAAFAVMKKISIDYAVLERADNVFMLAADFDWDDLGSWESVARYGRRDADSNTTIGTHVGLGTRNCVVVSDSGVVATIGMENCVVVKTPDAVLVAKREDAEKVKQLLAELERRGHSEVL